MKNFTYQLIRYQPDKISEEFVNVGIILLDKDKEFLRAKTIAKIGRVKHLFPKVNSRSFIAKLNNIANHVNTIADNWNQGLRIQDDLDIRSISDSIIPNDDSALYFSKVKKGIDINSEIAFIDLFQRMVSNNELDTGHYMTDKDVWSSYYKTYFHRQKAQFQTKSIVTEGDELNFDFAIKNGVWNYLEPVTFDLSRKSNIKEKVYKWMGKLDELESSTEEFKLFLLTKMPENAKLRKFILDRLENHTADNYKLEIIEPINAEKFSQKLINSVNTNN